jgi:hypothetical protein
MLFQEGRPESSAFFRPHEQASHAMKTDPCSLQFQDTPIQGAADSGSRELSEFGFDSESTGRMADSLHSNVWREVERT